MQGHTATVSSLVLAAPDLLVSGGGDYALRLWCAPHLPVEMSYQSCWSSLNRAAEGRE